MLYEIGGSEFEDIQSSSQKLQIKFLEYYGDYLIVHKGTTKRGSIIFSASLEVEKALRKEVCFQNKLKTQIRDVAFELRKSIMNAETKTLPNELQLQDIVAGEIDIQDIVLQFFSCLIVGPDIGRLKSAAKARRINSICSDAIFAATSGRKKPTKYLMLGMAVKSLTGSRKIIEVLNKYGHCVTYHTVEELKRELTFKACGEDLLTPHGMSLSSNLGTCVIFDNYDSFVETLSRKDALHYTVAIAYQVIEPVTTNYEETDFETINDVHNNKFLLA